MSIPETISFDKTGEPESEGGGWASFLQAHVRKLFIALVILLVATLSFGLGRLTGSGAGEGVKIEFDPSITTGPSLPTSNQASVSSAIAPLSHSAQETGVVASKSGSKYHYPSCPGAKQIKETNKILFPSPQAAEAAGYTLASNCKSP